MGGARPFRKDRSRVAVPGAKSVPSESGSRLAAHSATSAGLIFPLPHARRGLGSGSFRRPGVTASHVPARAIPSPPSPFYHVTRISLFINASKLQNWAYQYSGTWERIAALPFRGELLSYSRTRGENCVMYRA